MGKRECTKCKTEKDTTSFYKDSRSKSGYAYWCKECQRVQFHNRYACDENLRNRKSQQKRRNKDKKIDIVRAHFLSNPCVDCGEADLCVLEFDHRDPKTKKYGIAQILCNNHSIETLLEEMQKCDVRCANCHRRRTAKQQQWWSNV